jgi:hypothetical protein
MKLWEKYRKGK